MLGVIGFLVWGHAEPRTRRGGTQSEARTAIVRALELDGWPPLEVDTAIALESGWQPSAVNPTSHAVGLIQFMPATLKAVGFPGTWEDFRRLSALEQLPYIRRYFAPMRWRQEGDTYVAMAYPAALGKPDSFVIGPVGSVIWEQNSPLREAGAGPVTAGSIRRKLLERVERRIAV